MEIKNKIMKEQEIINLGFERTDDNDGLEKYHYYTLEIGNDYSPLCLITNDNGEAKNDNWEVSIFNYESIIITDIGELKKLIELLKNNVK